MLIGADAVEFAQSQFSGDVRTVVDGGWQWNAWLDPRGRVRSLFQLLRFDATRLALLPRGGDGDALATTLSRYVLRARVQVGVGPSLALTDANAPLPAQLLRDRDDGWYMGFGDYATRLTPPRGDGRAEWRHRDILRGHPWLPEPLLSTLLPPALSLNRLGAVSIGKGCYPGQEITARLHYRGRHKRSLCRVAAPALTPAAVLRQDQRDVGVVLQVVTLGDAAEALAVLHDDALERADGGAPVLQCDDAPQVRVLERFAQ